jgi:DAACS family dicarboxylate/amino acid:cation (Na+ or H+) symporter
MLGARRRVTIQSDAVSEASPGKRGIPLYVQILGAMAVGLVLGPILGKSATPLDQIGKLVIQLIKGVATPLLFCAIVGAIVKTRVEGRAAVRMLIIAGINASLAMTIGLAISNVFVPGRHLGELMKGSGGDLSRYQDKKVDLIATLTGYVPSNVVTPFAENLILSVVLLALLFGFALRTFKHEAEAEGSTAFRAVEDLVESLRRVFEIALSWIIKLIPLAVFAVVTKSVGEHGYAPLRGLGVYVLVGLAGLALHILIVYQGWLIFVVHLGLRRFWREAREPVFYALGTNSSLATLPVTLRALDRLGVSRGASALGACVGTNLNNDGIILYEGMALLFVAQAAGIELSLGQQLLAAATCMVAAMGIAGVPEAGFISLAVVLNTLGLPVEILPLLLTVDWIIARGRSVTNVLSDMMLSIVIDRGGQVPESGEGPETVSGSG